MIARIWRGVTSESDKDTYFEYLQATGLKEYAAVPGNQGVWVLRRVSGGEAEFTLISLWESWDAIKAFAGPDHERAVYYPEDKRFLLHLDPEVRHYEVLSSPLG
jgi:heme-degrading monooxygenase HmoA